MITPIPHETETSTEYLDIYNTIYGQDYAFEVHHHYNAEELALEVV
jgi:hypothetical protein